MPLLRRHFTPFVLLLLVALLIIGLDQSRRIEQPQDWGQRLTQPFQEWFTGLTDNGTGFWQAMTRFEEVRAENETLRDQIEQLTLVNVQTIELRAENERLRDLLEFKESNPNYMLVAAAVVDQETPARVIGEETSGLIQAVRIDQGRESGIAPGMSVITSQGLVGRIQEVGDNWAQVLLVTDESSEITAYGLEGRASGVVQGTGDGLAMRYIPHEQRVEPGDVVLSSGLGGQFPRGLVIGTVESVVRNDVNPWQEVVVSSTINFEQLDYLFVIRSFVPTDDSAPAATPTP